MKMKIARNKQWIFKTKTKYEWSQFIWNKKTRIYYQSIEIEINLNGNYC